jgi:hypothetical protein
MNVACKSYSTTARRTAGNGVAVFWSGSREPHIGKGVSAVLRTRAGKQSKC